MSRDETLRSSPTLLASEDARRVFAVLARDGSPGRRDCTRYMVGLSAVELLDVFRRGTGLFLRAS